MSAGKKLAAALKKRKKEGFTPVGPQGPAPAEDPAMAGMGGGGGAPVDPNTGMPMDPQMGMGGAPMDPMAMMGGAPMDPEAMAESDPLMDEMKSLRAEFVAVKKMLEVVLKSLNIQVPATTMMDAANEVSSAAEKQSSADDAPPGYTPQDKIAQLDSPVMVGEPSDIPRGEYTETAKPPVVSQNFRSAMQTALLRHSQR